MTTSDFDRREGRGEGPTAVREPLPPLRYDWPESTASLGSARTGLLDRWWGPAHFRAWREWSACRVFPGDAS